MVGPIPPDVTDLGRVFVGRSCGPKLLPLHHDDDKA